MRRTCRCEFLRTGGLLLHAEEDGTVGEESVGVLTVEERVASGECHVRTHRYFHYMPAGIRWKRISRCVLLRCPCQIKGGVQRGLLAVITAAVLRLDRRRRPRARVCVRGRRPVGNHGGRGERNAGKYMVQYALYGLPNMGARKGVLLLGCTSKSPLSLSRFASLLTFRRLRPSLHSLISGKECAFSQAGVRTTR